MSLNWSSLRGSGWRLAGPVIAMATLVSCTDGPTQLSRVPPRADLSIGSGAHAIQIDANGLSAVWLDLYAVPSVFIGQFQPGSITVQLDAGDYTLAYGTQVVSRLDGLLGGRPEIAFTVTAAGTVDFPTTMDGMLTGRGSTNLLVTGAVLTVDVSPLSATFVETIFSGPFYFLESGPTPVRLFPGKHHIRYGTGYVAGVGDMGVVEFTVGANGLIGYEATLDGIMEGHGTAALLIQGADVAVDVSPLAASGVAAPLGGFVTLPGVSALRLLPGVHVVGYPTAINRRIGSQIGGTAHAEFVVGHDGLVSYATELEGTLTGLGTAELIVDGVPIDVDVSALDSPEVLIERGTLYTFPTTGVLRLLPGVHWVGYQTVQNVYGIGFGFGRTGQIPVGNLNALEFTVHAGGTVTYAPDAEGTVSGHGTGALAVHGRRVDIDLSAIDATGLLTFLGGSAGVSLPNGPTQLTLLPGLHEIYYVAASGSIGGMPYVEFELDLAGNVDYESSLDLALAGRGTPTLDVRGIDISIDATCTAFNPPQFHLYSAGSFPTTAVHLFTVLPGPYRIDVGNDPPLILVFGVARNGLVDYPVDFEPNLAGRGSSALRIRTDAPACNDLLAPVVRDLSVSQNPVPVGVAVSVGATIDDASTGASIIGGAEYALDGGSYSPIVANDGVFDESTESVAGQLGPFASAGVHEVCVRGADVAGNVAVPECTLLAVFDPNGGFVSGGGWFTSPTGAYLADPDLTGKANFGFVSKYLKGATVPTGSTEFQFRTGNLNFHSTAYEWLVVAGARAQYKGSGRINNSGDYGFILTAIDGQVPGGGGVDRFRIKIWDRGTGSVVYDNHVGASDSADPVTAVQGGSIVIHK